MCLTKHLCNIKLVSLESGKTTAIIKTGLETRLSNTLVVSGFYSTELHLPVHNKPLIGRFREVLNVFGAGEPRRQHGRGGGGQGHVQLSAGGVASATTGSAPAHRSKNTLIASISLENKACISRSAGVLQRFTRKSTEFIADQYSFQKAAEIENIYLSDEFMTSDARYLIVSAFTDLPGYNKWMTTYVLVWDLVEGMTSLII